MGSKAQVPTVANYKAPKSADTKNQRSCVTASLNSRALASEVPLAPKCHLLLPAGAAFLRRCQVSTPASAWTSSSAVQRGLCGPPCAAWCWERSCMNLRQRCWAVRSASSSTTRHGKRSRATMYDVGKVWDLIAARDITEKYMVFRWC